MNIIKETILKIQKIDYSLTKKTQQRLDNLTKPKGSLGLLEEIAKQVVEITKQEKPQIRNKVIFTLAGDHGIAEEGVSAFPQEVTPQMVYNFLKGGAGINVLARHVGAKVIVADMGIKGTIIKNTDLSLDNFKEKKIASGTKNFTKGPAMTKEQAIKSIEAGIALFEEELKNGIDIAGTGEMGIGNTTPASAITTLITHIPIEESTGRGTGIDDSSLALKIAAIKKGITVNQPNPKDALDVLAKVGGFEIGGLAGVILAAARHRVPVVIDGFISGAAALLAYTLAPNVKDYMLGSHLSQEKGHKAIMDYIGLKPLFDFNMRLGEGTGAALAIGIIEASIKILNEMATFESAGVSQEN